MPTTGIRKVLVGGCFDIVHYGHLVFLQQARLMGDSLIVLLEPDERILHHKQRAPVHNQTQRAEILRSLRLVDEVISIPLLNSYEEYFKWVQEIHPNIIAVTEGDPQLAAKQKQAQAIGGEVHIVTPLLTGFSSTEIMRRLSL